MSVKIRKSLVASALVGAFALASGSVVAGPLNDLQKAEQQTTAAAAKSQEKINQYFEQSQELLAEYRSVVEQTEMMKVYNDYVQRLVEDQRKGIDSFDRQIAGIENTKKALVPLMLRMVDMLEQFVNADLPIQKEDRLARVARLREMMGSANVADAEKYRLILDAYQIEKDIGISNSAWQGTLNVDGAERTVDFVHMGRVSLVAQSLDMKNVWAFNPKTRQWEALGDEYLSAVKKAIRIARKLDAPELVKLPVMKVE